MSVRLLNDHHLRFLSLKGDYTDSSESTLVKMPHCCRSHVVAHIIALTCCFHEASLQNENKKHNSFGLATAILILIILHFQMAKAQTTCADPESFVRGGPTLTIFFFFFFFF